MTFAHWRTRRKLSLLAFEALEGGEREEAMRHVSGCEACAAELGALRATLAAFAEDAVRTAEPALPLEMLVSRTRARLDEGPSRPLAGLWSWRVAVPVAGAAVALFALVVGPRMLKPAAERQAEATTPREAITVSADTLRVIERNVAREQAARYLSDAQDLLVTVASTPARCDRRAHTLDVSEESERSRALLARRALALDLSADDITAARPLLEDVERMLREVAALDPCARPQDLEALREQLRERRLLMKIDLMTRELQG